VLEEKFFVKVRQSSFLLTRAILLRFFWVSFIAVNSLGSITAIAFFFIYNFSSKFSFIGFLDKCESPLLKFSCV
jgi:hypothetical protein